GSAQYRGSRRRAGHLAPRDHLLPALPHKLCERPWRGNKTDLFDSRRFQGAQAFDQCFRGRSHGGGPHRLGRPKARLLRAEVNAVTVVEGKMVAVLGKLLLVDERLILGKEPPDWLRRRRRILHSFI